MDLSVGFCLDSNCKRKHDCDDRDGNKRMKTSETHRIVAKDPGNIWLLAIPNVEVTFLSVAVVVSVCKIPGLPTSHFAERVRLMLSMLSVSVQCIF